MSKFGWSYPPGAAGDPYAPYNQMEGPCECCGHFPDECICPVCNQCNGQGDPKCYKEHGLEFNPSQRLGMAQLRLLELKHQVADQELYISWLKGEIDRRSNEPRG